MPSSLTCSEAPQKHHKPSEDTWAGTGWSKDADKRGWKKNKNLFVLWRKLCGPPYSNVLHAQEDLEPGMGTYDLMIQQHQTKME